MGSENFYRTYTLKCGPKGGAGFQIGNIRSATEDVLHISFSVEKSDSETPNTAKIQIWNLSDANLKVLDEKDVIVELKAGYGDNMALAMVGSVTYVTTTRDGADRMTELEVADGRVELRETNISVSMNDQVDTREVYTYVANQMGLSVLFAKDLSFVKLPNGFSFVGKGKNALQRIAEANGHDWTIQNGVIQITIPGRPVTTQGYLLDIEHGLVSIPKRITISQSSENSDSMTGWEIEYFLNAAIGINDVVQLNSSTANGYYRIHKVTFNGDNMEGDWVCTAQVLEIKALPKLDVKAAEAT